MTTLKTAQKQVKILGIRVDSTDRDSLLTSIGNFISHNKKFSLFTPNPEIILQAQNDRELASAIGNSTFSIPDGIGLKIFGDSTLKIIHGRKLMVDLLKMANERNLRVFFITSDERTNTNEKLLKRISSEFGNIKAKAVIGPRLDKEAIPVTEIDTSLQIDIVNKINQFKPHLLFVTFGAPKQEKWITKWLPKLNVVGALGIGGSLDYYAGTEKLPPKWMEKFELEWLWRLITQPYRFRRIINAVFVFPLIVLFKKVE